MEYRVYKFPTLIDGRIKVEEAYFELLKKYKNGENLDPEEVDWMDTANTWLHTIGNKL